MKVSICIPTFNQEKYVELAIRSAHEQTLKPFEIIVSNDCSTDGTKAILDRLEKEIPELKIIHQPINLGIAKNVDACLRAGSGNYIIRLDSDDWLMPEYTQKLIQQLSLYPNAGYAHAAVQEIDQDGKPTIIRRLARKSGFQTSDEALHKAVSGYRVAANIVMYRREALEKVNYVSFNINFAEDYYMVTSISVAGYGNLYLNEILSNYRVWIDNNKVRQKRKLAEIEGLAKIFNDLLEPAFKKRNWNLSSIKSNRASFAKVHATCLGWSVYTKAEKEELANSIYNLSSDKSVVFVVKSYLSGAGFIFDAYTHSVSGLKLLIKKFLFR